jgi:hypothetical protein
MGPYSRYFAVPPADRLGYDDYETAPDSITTSILQDLTILKREQEERGNVVVETSSESVET